MRIAVYFQHVEKTFVWALRSAYEQLNELCHLLLFDTGRADERFWMYTIAAQDGLRVRHGVIQVTFVTRLVQVSTQALERFQMLSWACYSHRPYLHCNDSMTKQSTQFWWFFFCAADCSRTVAQGRELEIVE